MIAYFYRDCRRAILNEDFLMKMADYILSGPKDLYSVPDVPLGKYLYDKIKEHGNKIAQVSSCLFLLMCVYDNAEMFYK